LLAISAQQVKTMDLLYALASFEASEVTSSRCFLKPLNNEFWDYVAENQRRIRATQFTVTSHLLAALGHRASMVRMISSAHRTASSIAQIVAGTQLTRSNWASFRAARMAAAISRTR